MYADDPAQTWLIVLTSSEVPRLPPRPDLDWGEDAVPRAREADDVYFSVADGLEETREVFFRGCGLPERWMDKEIFTVAELGFGTGLNIAALLDLWDKSGAKGRLDIVSFEGRLMRRDDAAAALSAWPELAWAAGKLLAQWPERARGVQRLHLSEHVRLTLHQDDIGEAIKSASFAADAWFLDGFSPAKNPAMWTEEVMGHVGRLSAPCAVIGTYTVAGHVRRSLAAAGFEVAKKPGFAKKRERLEAIFPTDKIARSAPDPLLIDYPPERPKSAIIVGAGIMGACLGLALQGRGVKVTIVGRGEDYSASQNPVGLVMPRLDAADTPQARALIDAYLYARRFYLDQKDALFKNSAFELDVLQPGSGETDRQKFSALKADPPLDEGRLKVEKNTLFHHGGVGVKPRSIVRALLGRCSGQVTGRVLEVSGGQNPHVTLETGEKLGADIIIIAAGAYAEPLLDASDIPIEGKAGQIESADWAGERFARAGGRYVVGLDDRIVFGATFERWSDDQNPPVSEASRKENIEELYKFAPDLSGQLNGADLKSHTGVRATTQDRFPFIGRVPDRAAYSAAFGDDLRTGRALVANTDVALENIYAAGGLGARGFTWAPWLAQIGVSMMFGEVTPTEHRTLETISPARFLMRRLKRGR